ncbi:sigma-70 family RNA polymerase sigma factor [uncultured Veillonella sp.]|uniref:sigma-70 family RNA polymerase sigma factor n=1 Tax=uncultured Veillonella sp. TaxID=159268 RepID=UPI002635C11D|nr:sigma-70 family RNA polymerase sigma factor [uncultured Veillonella sp.]
MVYLDTSYKSNIVKLAQAGHAQSIAQLCQNYEPLIRKYASLTPVHKVKEDLENELWCCFLKALKEYDASTHIPFSGFIKSRIKYGQYNLFKKYRHQWEQESCILGQEFDSDRKPDSNILNLEDLLNPADSAEYEYMKSHTYATLHKALQQLAPKQRDLLKDIYIHQKSMAQLGRDYNISRQAIHKHKQRALAALQVHFKELLHHDTH